MILSIKNKKIKGMKAIIFISIIYNKRRFLKKGFKAACWNQTILNLMWIS